MCTGFVRRNTVLVGRRLRRRTGEEHGAVAVVVAVSMVVFIGMGALAIDLSSFYQAQRQAQTAADAAALGAAQDLPNGTTASSDATSLGQENDPGSTVASTTPYGGSTSKIMVKVSASTPAILGQIFGVTSANVSATAVAGPASTASYDAFFASDTSCTGTANLTGVSVTATGASINGAVISNGYLSVTGGSDALGPTTDGGPNGCTPKVTGTGDTFTTGPTPNPTAQTWPTDYTSYGANASNCTYTSASTGTAYSWPTGGATIPPGVYCAPNGTISVTGSNITATGVTFIAKAFTLSGSPINITPAAGANGLTIYQTGTTELDLTTSGLLQGGTVFAPNAPVRVSGSGTESGFIEAKDVWVSGSSFTFTGTGPSSAGIGGIALLQ
jgi:Flp pilus assembly protein TadG